MASALQQAWDNAQSKLILIRNSLYSRSTPNPRIIRVGQLDSELLDQELMQLLKEPLNKALSLASFSLHSRFEPELTLLIQLTLYKLSIWNIGASYGAKLQDLRYVASPSPGRALSPSGLPRRILLVHGVLTIFIPYLHTRLRAHALSNAWPDAPSSDRRRQAWGILTSLESSYTLLGLLNIVVFLWDGRYRTIVDRILKLNLVPSSRLVKRDVSYEFMNRQMVWHAFTEFLLFLLPLISGRTIRRRLIHITSYLNLKFLSGNHLNNVHAIDTSSKLTHKKRGKYWSLSLNQCAICAENASFNFNPADPTGAFASLSTSAPSNLISGPSPSGPQQDLTDTDNEPPAYPLFTSYRASCGDVYCYHCIAERMMRAADEEESWECLRCGERILSADRFVVDSRRGSEVSGSEVEFSDITDLSGSLSSYSE